MDPLERAVAKALAEKDSNAEKAEQPARVMAEEPRDPPEVPSEVPNKEQANADTTPEITSLSPVPLKQLEEVIRPNLVLHEVDPNALKRARIVGHLPGGKGANVYTMLRSQVMLKLRNNSCRSLAIIGPHVAIGKSSVAANLALSIARKKDQPVALVDLDLRKPTLTKVFGIKPKYDVGGYLDGRYNASQVCIRTQFEGLHLCPGGPSYDNAAELLDSPKAKSLFEDLKKLLQDPIIIVDLPPIIGVSDVHTFLPNCDAALVALEYGKTSKNDIEETLRLLGTTALAGYIINKGHLDGDAAYGYGYGNTPEGND